MTLYAGIVRPLLFRLEAEAAHRLALAKLLAKDGFAHVADAVGVDVR